MIYEELWEEVDEVEEEWKKYMDVLLEMRRSVV